MLRLSSALILSFPLGVFAGGGSVRQFNLTQQASIDEVPPSALIHVWLPVPQNDAEQIIKTGEQNFPADSQINRDPRFGNVIRSFVAPADTDGKLKWSCSYQITRTSAGIDQHDDRFPIADAMGADRLVPVNGKPMELIKDNPPSGNAQSVGESLFHTVEDYLDYRKDMPGWGRGDAVWACDSHFGNCTDFHSLFISLARSEKLPAIFQIGYAIPTSQHDGVINGYHCWAWFNAKGVGWIPVDISESKQTGVQQFGRLNADRVAFSTGRDLQLVPRQAGSPLNYFINPYVEVDGSPLSPSHLHLQITYEDKM